MIIAPIYSSSKDWQENALLLQIHAKAFFSDKISGFFIIYVPASNQICDNLLLTGKRARKSKVRRHQGGDSR